MKKTKAYRVVSTLATKLGASIQQSCVNDALHVSAIDICAALELPRPSIALYNAGIHNAPTLETRSKGNRRIVLVGLVDVVKLMLTSQMDNIDIIRETYVTDLSNALRDMQEHKQLEALAAISNAVSDVPVVASVDAVVVDESPTPTSYTKEAGLVLSAQTDMWGSVRAVNIGGTVYFTAKEVAKALGYKDPKSAVNRHCRGEVKRHPIEDGIGRKQLTRVITEADVTRLVTKSKLPEAQRFEAWIHEEVLPAIRKSGMYVSSNRPVATADDNELMLSNALVYANAKIQQVERSNQMLLENNQQIKNELEAAQPAVEFAKSVAETNDLILIRDLAKIITQNGVEIGQNRLFEWLKQKNYLIRSRSHYDPTQYAMEMGLFRIVESLIPKADGSGFRLSKTVKVTGKGQVFFVNKIKKEGL